MNPSIFRLLLFALLLCLTPALVAQQGASSTVDSLRSALRTELLDSLTQTQRLDRLEDKLDQAIGATANNIVGWSGFVLTALVFLIGAGAWFAGNRFNEIEKIRKELSQLLGNTRSEVQQEMEQLKAMKADFDQERDKTFRLVFPLLQAEWYFQRGDFGRSLAAYREAQSIEPGSTDINRRINKILTFEGNFQEAIENLAVLLRDEPENCDYLVTLAENYRRLGDYEQAKSIARKALLIRPDFGTAAYELGSAELYSGNFSEAEKAFAKSVDLFLRYDGNPRFFALTNLAFSEWQLDRSKAVAKTAKRARDHIKGKLVNVPTNTNLLANLGLAETLLGNYRAAVSAFKKSIVHGLPTEPAKSMKKRIDLIAMRVNNKSIEKIQALLEEIIQRAI